MATNPIKWTSRTFASILADINGDPELVDKPDWWKRMIAGLGDVLSAWENASANQAFLRTAKSRRAVVDLAELIDYHPSGRATASGSVLFDLKPDATLPDTIPAADLAAITQGGSQASAKRFEARSSLAVSALTEVTAAAAWNVGTDQVTVAAEFTTGERLRVTTSGTLPTGSPAIALATDYYAIRVDATHVRLATTRQNAKAGTYVDILTAGTGNHTLTRLSRAATCYQQTSVASEQVGTSDGATAWQEFRVNRVGVLVETLAITVNAVTWTRVDTLVDSGPADTHYRLQYNTDGTAVVVFGDGVYGAIPGAFPVLASYAYGGGVDSNVSVAGGVSVYAGASALLEGAWNPGALTGGTDEEAIASIKRLGPLLLKAQNRFVTAEDGRALTEKYGGVTLAAVIANAYGVLTAKVVGIANGGGNPSGALRTAIEGYLEDRSVLQSIDVTFDVATITAHAVTSAAKVASGYVWAEVLPLFRLAWKLYLSSSGKEINDTYLSSGVAAARALINTICSETYVAADEPAITRLLDLYDRIPPRDFGETIQESDAKVFIQGGVLGIDHMTITAPAFPIVNAATEIANYGALTLSEIP